MSEIILQMKNITKRFLAVTALQEVNFHLFKGEIHTLVGENGAGKSTLMKILSGSYPGNSYNGVIEISGEKMNFMNTADSEHAGIQMIYQEISLNLDLMVAENLFLGKLPRNIFGIIKWKEMYANADKALDLIDLKIDPKMKVRALNTSQKQLISIAKALMREPKILVLDEPTSALTEKETENLLNILMTLKEKGISCIYISHRLEEVFKIADRVTILRDGNVVSTYNRNEINSEKIIEDMVGRKITQMYPKQKVPIGNDIFHIEGFTVQHISAANKNIIEDVSFSVRKGEILGIGGLVGSGRSELVNAIFGSIPKKSGRIFLEGSEIKIDSPKDAIEKGIALVTEDRKMNGFVGTMNVRENTTLASLKEVFGKLFIKKNYEIETAQKITQKLNLKAPSIETNILNLSGGNQQKVVLSKWLLKKIKVLILDEPTRGIDVGAKVEIYNIISQLVSNGIAVIMISSELPELLAMCDRFVILHKGKVAGNFSRNEVNEENIMKAATGLLQR